MTTVAVLGGGAGGRSAVVELTFAGHDVRLWNRNRTTVADLLGGGELRYRGVFGEGAVEPSSVTTDLAQALDGADVAVICLPSMTHDRLFHDLAALECRIPIVLNPGHTGGALQAREVWRRRGTPMPPMAEFSTLTYVARVHEDHVVATTGRAGAVRAACLPGGESALEFGLDLFPGAVAVGSVLASSLSNVNMVLHPPGAVLSLAWAEATGGDFRFYVDAMTDGVGSVLRQLDAERLAVAAALDAEVLSLLDEMTAIGTVDRGPDGDRGLVEAIRSGVANQRIRGPESTRNRYYREDFPFGLAPFIALSEVAGVATPTATSLLTLATAAIGPDLLDGARDASVLGMSDLTRDELIASVR